MLTKGAIGNLVNRYKAVLKKCNLINTFGSLAVASMLVMGGAGVAGAETDADKNRSWGDSTITTSSQVKAEYDGYTLTHTWKDYSPNIGAAAIYIDGKADKDIKISGVDFKNNTVVENYTGENKDKTSSNYRGGAVWVNQNAQLTIEGSDFVNNKIVLNNKKAEISEKVDGGGGALAVTEGSHVDLTDCDFEGNAAGNGGGAIYFNKATGTINGGSFTGNTATGRGGAIMMTKSSVEVLGKVDFTKNTAGTGGGAINLKPGCTLTFGSVTDGDVTFTDNVATKNGGAIYNEGSVEFNGKKVTFISNEAGINGGAFANNTDDFKAGTNEFFPSVVFNGEAEFKNNTATGLGGAIYNPLHASVTFNADATFTGNTANGVANDIYNAGTMNVLAGTTTLNSGMVQDGGHTTVAKDATLNIASGEFKNGNTAAYGGAIHNSGILEVNNVTFEKNIADTKSDSHGGAIYNLGKLTVKNSIFKENEAGSKGRGGAIFNDNGELTIKNSKFSGNSSNYMAGTLYSSKGILNVIDSDFDGTKEEGLTQNSMIYLNQADATFTGTAEAGNVFKNNVASQHGGAMEIDAATVTFEGKNTFSGNTAGDRGGAFWNAAGSVTFADNGTNTFTGNSAAYGGAIYNSGELVLGGTNLFKDNTASEAGNDIYNEGTIRVASGVTTLYGGLVDAKPAVAMFSLRNTPEPTVTVDSGAKLVIAGGENAINTLGGEGEIQITNAEASLDVDTVAAGSKPSITASGEVNDAVGGDANKLDVTIDGKKLAESDIYGGMDEGKVYGAVDENGNMAKNTLMDAVVSQTSITTVAIDKLLTNDVRKRLGDIRSDKNESGVWMRWDGGKLKGDNGLTNDFNTIQIGGDTKVGKNCRLGVAGSFTHGEAEFGRGNAELEGFSLAAYSTWMGDNGMFADVVARLGKFSNEMNVEGDKGDTDNRVFSLSGEYGWRLPVCDQFFLEPQVELAYTYVSSDTLELGDAKYLIDNMDSLTGRVGLVAGWNLPNDRGNVYARASVLHQFMGDAKITGTINGNSNVQKTDGDDSWIEYGIGANVKLTDKTYIWADVERTECADIDEEWRGTVGIRYSF